MQFHAQRPVSGRIKALGGLPSIGVDSEVGSKGDMFDQMRTTLLVERMFGIQDAFASIEGDAAPQSTAVGTGGSPVEKTPIRGREVLEWATVNNAAALGMDGRIGSLTPGKQADLIMVRREALHIVSAQDPAQAIVSYAQPNDVSLVMIAGRIVKENGSLLLADLVEQWRPALLQSAQRLMRDSAVPIV